MLSAMVEYAGSRLSIADPIVDSRVGEEAPGSRLYKTQTEIVSFACLAQRMTLRENVK